MNRFNPMVHSTDSTTETRIITRHPTPPPSGRISTLPIRMATSVTYRHALRLANSLSDTYPSS